MAFKLIHKGYLKYYKALYDKHSQCIFLLKSFENSFTMDKYKEVRTRSRLIFKGGTLTNE